MFKNLTWAQSVSQILVEKPKRLFFLFVEKYFSTKQRTLIKSQIYNGTNHEESSQQHHDHTRLQRGTIIKRCA